MGALQRTDSEAVLVETAESIHADSADEEESLATIEVRSISEDGFGPAEYVESGDEADRGEVELEAVNPHVHVLRQDHHGGGQHDVLRQDHQHGQVITINMDTTSSVI